MAATKRTISASIDLSVEELRTIRLWYSAHVTDEGGLLTRADKLLAEKLLDARNDMLDAAEAEVMGKKVELKIYNGPERRGKRQHPSETYRAKSRNLTH